MTVGFTSITDAAGRKIDVSMRISSFNRIRTASIEEVHDLVSCGILGDNYDMAVVQDPENYQVQ